MLNEVKRLCKDNFEDMIKCKHCKGSGEYEHFTMARVITKDCSYCNGTGKKLKNVEPNGKYLGKVKAID